MTVYILIDLSGAETFSQIVTSLVSVAVRNTIPRSNTGKKGLSYTMQSVI